jgi:Chaperone of endosialidase
MTSINNTLFVNRVRNSVGINNSLPRYTLDVIGTMNVTSTITAGANIVCACNIFVDGAQVITSGGTGGATNFTQFVGIGCNTPRYPLDVNGSANIAGDLYVGGNASSNIIRFRGTTGDDEGYLSTAIAERIYETNNSELLFFKGNDVGTIGNPAYNPDRIRILSAGGFKVDIAPSTSNWPVGAEPPAAAYEALTIDSSGNVGINCNSPSSTYKLDVNGTLNVSGLSYFAGAASVKKSIVLNTFHPTNPVQFQFVCSPTTGGGVESNVFHLIKYGPTSGTGTVIFSIPETTGNMSYSGNIVASNVTARSDLRKKTNITTIEDSLEKIQQMRGVYYNKKDCPSKSRNVGFIAQHLESALPEVVDTNPADEGYKSVSYGNITAILIEGMKSQQSTISSMLSSISSLKASRASK